MSTADSLVFSTEESGKQYTGRNETLFTTANGFLGFRGDYEEKAGCVHKGTYINGFYDTEPITYGETAYGYAKNHETILNLPDPKNIELQVNGRAFSAEGCGRSFRMELDFRTGIMKRTVGCMPDGGTSYTVCAERLVSFAHKTCAAIRYTVTAGTSSAPLSILLTSGIDTTASNITAEEDPRVAEELGDLLFSVVNLCRKKGIDPETAMAGANRKFERRFNEMERLLAKDGLSLEEASAEAMEARWQQAKSAR